MGSARTILCVLIACLLPTVFGTDPRIEPQERVVLTFPQIADGYQGPFAVYSTVILLNNSPDRVEGTLELHRSDGSNAPFDTRRGTDSEFAFDIDPGKVFRLETSGSGPVAEGWARILSSGPLTGTGRYTVHNRQSGAFVSEVGVDDSPQSDDLLIFVDTRGYKETGYAVCNPGSSKASLLLELKTMEGEQVASRVRELGPGMQFAEFAGETFSGVDLTDFRGVLHLASNLPVSMISLRSRGPHFTSLPSVPGLTPPPAGDLVFPRLGDGYFGQNRFSSSFILMNPSSDDTAVSIAFYGAKGNDLELPLDPEPANQVQATVPAGGAVELTTQGITRPGVVGWARAVSAGGLGAAATFTIVDSSSGEFLSEVGIPATSTLESPLISVRESETASTGLAISNTSADTLTLQVELYEEEDPSLASGMPALPTTAEVPVAQAELELEARGHAGIYVRELFPDLPLNEFQGTLRMKPFVTRYGVDITAPIAALTLLLHHEKMTSMPAAPLRVTERPLSSWDTRAEELLEEMTLEEKIGQMTQADQEYLVDEADIEDFYLGSLLSGGNSDPVTNNLTDWREMYERYQGRALKTRLGIPLLYGVDAIHGHSNVVGAVIFPHNIGLGGTRNPTLVERIARLTAVEVKATGINWTFSPCVAVPQDERWGRTYEGFGEDPDIVRSLAEAAVRGYQGKSLADPRSIVACAKHYLGDGGTTWGTGIPIDQGDTRLDETTLRRLHLPGYLGALSSGVATIMPSFSSWNGQKMSGHRYLLTQVLKTELGFEGFLISDWAAIDQLPGDYRSDIKTSINAGMDMVMVPDKYREFFYTLKDLVVRGEIPIARINDAVRRILRVKFAAGLFDRSPMADRGLEGRFGSSPHRELAREAVRQSVVLLKNAGSVLPISKSTEHIHVAGRSADDIGNQCGGWTIRWQGESGNITAGTTILQAIRETVSEETRVTYSQTGSGAETADVGIVVIGEIPYAEMIGDSGELLLHPDDLAAVSRVHAAGIPVVVVLVSGRPLILGPVLQQADALVAAWLPGTEGQGVADVLFGDYPPTGKLPCSWPRSLSQVPINKGDPGYDPLFELDFGLTY